MNTIKKQSEVLQKIWTDAKRFRAWESTARLHSFLQIVSEIFGGNEAVWLALKNNGHRPRGVTHNGHQAIVEQTDGWYPVSAEYLNEGRADDGVMVHWLMHVKKYGRDLFSSKMLEDAGKSVRAYIRHDFMDDEAWNGHWVSQTFLPCFNVGERLVGFYPLNDHCEACIAIDRPIGAEAFTPEERDFLILLMASVPNMHRRLFLERGALNGGPLLSNREREIYRLLLTDCKEKNIAEELNLSFHTVHDYARRLYQKFDVKGRAGIMSLALG